MDLFSYILDTQLYKWYEEYKLFQKIKYVICNSYVYLILLLHHIDIRT